jgi:ferric-dicitrate binding protein FerR (iron transport regulator)
MPEEKYIRLIALRLNNEAGRLENQELESWIAAHPDHRRRFAEMQRIWQRRRPAPEFDSRAAFAKLQPKLFS